MQFPVRFSDSSVEKHATRGDKELSQPLRFLIDRISRQASKLNFMKHGESLLYRNVQLMQIELHRIVKAPALRRFDPGCMRAQDRIKRLVVQIAQFKFVSDKIKARQHVPHASTARKDSFDHFVHSIEGGG